MRPWSELTSSTFNWCELSKLITVVMASLREAVDLLGIGTDVSQLVFESETISECLLPPMVITGYGTISALSICPGLVAGGLCDSCFGSALDLACLQARHGPISFRATRRSSEVKLVVGQEPASSIRPNETSFM